MWLKWVIIFSVFTLISLFAWKFVIPLIPSTSVVTLRLPVTTQKVKTYYERVPSEIDSLSLLKRVGEKDNLPVVYDIRGNDFFIYQIGQVDTRTLTECHFSMAINGEITDIPPDKYIITNGDRVEWILECDETPNSIFPL